MLAAVFCRDAKPKKMERPKIKDFFPKETSLSDAMDIYEKSPILFSYIKAVDAYADSLETALDEIANPIKYMNLRLKEGERLNGLFANSMSDSANYLKEIATEVLSANGS